MKDICDDTTPSAQQQDCRPLPLTDLMIQMIIIFVGRQAIGQIQEIAVPYVLSTSRLQVVNSI